MNDRDYIISERFIHDVLLALAEGAVRRIPELFRADKQIDPSLFLWPEEAVTTDEGDKINNLFIYPLPADNGGHRAQIQQAIKRTRAYAFLLIKSDGRQVRALFESPHGTRAWVFPIKRSADAWVLGKVSKEDDKEALGLLWSPNQGHA